MDDHISKPMLSREELLELLMDWIPAGTPAAAEDGSGVQGSSTPRAHAG